MDRLDTDAESEYLVPMTEISRPFIQTAELLVQFAPALDPSSMGDFLRLTNSIVDLWQGVVEEKVDDALDAAESPFRRIMDEQSDEIVSLRAEVDYLRKDSAHEVMVHVARQDQTILDAMRGDALHRRKIDAIKRLRVLTGAGLKASKEAIEDPRVNAAANPLFEVVAMVMVNTDD